VVSWQRWRWQGRWSGGKLVVARRLSGWRWLGWLNGGRVAVAVLRRWWSSVGGGRVTVAVDWWWL
jgi:hypothetical protein